MSKKESQQPELRQSPRKRPAIQATEEEDGQVERPNKKRHQGGGKIYSPKKAAGSGESSKGKGKKK